MLANINNKNEAALLNEKSLTWDVIGWIGKNDSNDEEGWTLLSGGYVLTVDTYNKKLNPNGTDSEIYDPAKATWKSAGSTIVPLTDYPPYSTGCGKKPSPYDHEVGPAVLRPDGTVFATGANLCGPGNTSIYDTKTGEWKAGPVIPDDADIADGPASILPDGHVLVDTSPGYGTGPSTFWEFGLDDSWITIDQPTKPPLPSNQSTVHGRMLVTGSGSVMFMLTDGDTIWIYTKKGGWTYPDSWRPTICEGCYPTDVYIGQVNYAVAGTQFNGLSQGAAYGDDAQSATNFPLVLFTNIRSKHKFYARTHDHSTMGVATGSDLVSTLFDITPNIEPGKSTMVVIANGIPSLPVNITVHPTPSGN